VMERASFSLGRQAKPCVVADPLPPLGFCHAMLRMLAFELDDVSAALRPPETPTMTGLHGCQFPDVATSVCRTG